MRKSLDLPNTEIACAQIEALTVKLNTACVACGQLIDLLDALDAKLASISNANLQTLKEVVNAKNKHD